MVIIKTENRSILSGFLELDNMTNGFKAGEISVFASRPAIGKTAILMQIANFQSVNVLFLSFELSAMQLKKRFNVKSTVHIEDDLKISSLTIKDICAQNRIKAIFIDYIHLCPVKLLELKLLATEMNVPIICTSQLKRDSPDSKQLVSISADDYHLIDQVIFMTRPNYSGIAYFEINGIEECSLEYQSESCLFSDRVTK